MSPRITEVLPVNISKCGQFAFKNNERSFLHEWKFTLDPDRLDASHLLRAVRQIRETDGPVAFPTETVYGLGADATNSQAVLGIYLAKQRPIDNPLIVHVCSLGMLRDILDPLTSTKVTPCGLWSSSDWARFETSPYPDPIPKIYHQLIQRFWPGPLTIILPNPADSRLAPQVTAGLSTFGARMPFSKLALALIRLAERPLAAPSANASTKPSPTTAEHVEHDLQGRINIILDGGPCEVGVESTVVDGLSDPPTILRPGGISIEQLKECLGWESTVIGYKDGPESGKAPRAPGMKYKHYSPKAKVILVESIVGGNAQKLEKIRRKYLDGVGSIGILQTKLSNGSHPISFLRSQVSVKHFSQKGNVSYGLVEIPRIKSSGTLPPSNLLQSTTPYQHLTPEIPVGSEIITTPVSSNSTVSINVWEIDLGKATADIARNLFAGMRELDMKGVDMIFVEGIDDSEGREAAAVMNRLRKAAEVID